MYVVQAVYAHEMRRLYLEILSVDLVFSKKVDWIEIYIYACWFHTYLYCFTIHNVLVFICVPVCIWMREWLMSAWCMYVWMDAYMHACITKCPVQDSLRNAEHLTIRWPFWAPPHTNQSTLMTYLFTYYGFCKSHVFFSFHTLPMGVWRRCMCFLPNPKWWSFHKFGKG